MKLTALIFLFVLVSLNSYSQGLTADTTMAGRYYREARLMIDNRQYDKLDTILLLSQKSEELYTRYKNWIGILNSLCNQQIVYTRKPDEKNTLVLFKRILILSQKKVGKDNIYLAKAFNNLGVYYFIVNKFDLALDNYLKSLEIRKKILGEKSIDVATSYNNIGLVYSSKKDYDKALEYHFKSLAIKKELLGEKHIDVALSYNNIGSDFGRKGEYTKALENHLIALEIRKELLGEKHRDIAASYNDIGFDYRNSGQYEKTFENHFKALEIRLELTGEKNADVAYSYNTIGNDYYVKGDYIKALEYNTKALEIRKEILGNKHIDVARSISNIGNNYFRLNDNEKSIDYFLQALDIFKQLSGEKQASVADTYFNLGLLYNRKNELDTALKHHFKALEIRKELFSENDFSVVRSYDQIGEVLQKKYYEILDKGSFVNDSTSDIIVNAARATLTKSVEFKLKSLSIRESLSDTNKIYIAETYYNMGRYLEVDLEQPEKAIPCFNKALQLYQEKYGENSSQVAKVLGDIGFSYNLLWDFDKSNQYFTREIEILKLLPNRSDSTIYNRYFFIGENLYLKSEYNRALDFFFDALKLAKVTGTELWYLATIYHNIGKTYHSKSENDLALEYLIKASELIRTTKLDEEMSGEFSDSKFKEYFTALINNNIGEIYLENSNSELALDYFLTSIDIVVEQGDRSERCGIFTNIGKVYLEKRDFNKAIEYFNESLKYAVVRQDTDYNILSSNYSNIGLAYFQEKDYTSALDYLTRSLSINKRLYGNKHIETAKSYNLLGDIYFDQKDYSKALNNFQKALCSNIKNYYDSLNFLSKPNLTEYLEPKELIRSFMGKSNTLERLAYNSEDTLFNISSSLINRNDLKILAFLNINICDTIISDLRNSISKPIDKLALGTISNKVYENAIRLCIKFGTESVNPININNYYKNAFYYSERSKSVVLTEAIGEKEKLKFIGISDSILDAKQILLNKISYYEKNLAEIRNNDSKKSIYQSNLFDLNRQLEDLIKMIEKKSPEYFKLKYNKTYLTVENIMALLDEKTALRSFFSGDSTAYAFTITKNNIHVTPIQFPVSFKDSINWFRYGLTNTSPRMQESYLRLGYYIYQKLFPDIELFDNKIENLLIIPEGLIATIPFESLLTKSYTGDINNYKEYPFFIKNYNVSYSYSANLFFQTFANKTSSTSPVSKMNDWLSIAPVFDEKQQINLSTDELKRRLNWLQTDTMKIIRSMFDRNYISPLPSTAVEIESIYKLYNGNKMKAKTLLYGDANEKFIKSGILEKYRILHFATHGFVNSERPELSGLLLAQDTTGGEDGVLYSGEIYNLKLNADLVVLSACETGLGKIQKGEGIIGLTRALFFAGAKNVIVSLWQVPDKSTSDLMIDFYKNYLLNKSKQSYSESLRKAKLKMINEGIFSHPLYWSPFILNGK